jgi:hypothetical protein
MLDNDRPIVKTTDEARQGREMHSMRYVLGISLTAAIVILAAIYVYFRLAH